MFPKILYVEDIVELEKRGTIKKVYGGIMRNQTNIPEPFASREIKNKAKKKHLAKLAATLVEDNDIIFIDLGQQLCTWFLTYPKRKISLF